MKKSKKKNDEELGQGDCPESPVLNQTKGIMYNVLGDGVR